MNSVKNRKLFLRKDFTRHRRAGKFSQFCSREVNPRSSGFHSILSWFLWNVSLFRHETAIAEIFLLQIVLLVKIVLVCRCLTEQLKGGKRNITKTIDSLKATELMATAYLRTRESRKRLINLVLIEKNKIWDSLSFQCTLLAELPAWTLCLWS